MLNKRTTNFITNRLSNSFLRQKTKSHFNLRIKSFPKAVHICTMLPSLIFFGPTKYQKYFPTEIKVKIVRIWTIVAPVRKQEKNLRILILNHLMLLQDFP